MNYFEKYKNRAGGTFAENLSDSTTEFLIRKMKNSPSAQEVYVNDVTNVGVSPIIARIVSGDRIEDVEALFLPNQLIDIGDYIRVDDEYWLVWSTRYTTVTPKALLKRCNHTLTWKINGATFSHPAMVKNFFTFNTDDLEAKTLVDLDVDKGGLFAHLQSTSDSTLIDVGMNITISGHSYRVAGIDNVSFMRDSIVDPTKQAGMLKLTLNIMPDAINDDNTPKSEKKGGLWNK